MLADAYLRTIVEDLRQLLACRYACFWPCCAEPGIRHPLLDVVQERTLVCSPRERVRFFLNVVLLDEQVQALCDLALLDGRTHTFSACDFRLDQQRLRGLMLAPLERPAGMLGVMLLLDEQPAAFEDGEQQLLSASLPRCAQQVEEAYRQQAQISVQPSPSENQGEETQPLLMRNEVVSLVCHELRTPLSAIKGYAGLLQMYAHASPEQAMSPEQQRQYIDAILEQTRFLEMLVNDLLDISRMQHQKLVLHLTEVNVATLCNEMIQLGWIRAEQQGPGKYQLLCTVEEDLPPVRADGNRLRQVLLNIVENALKYSPTGGQIELEARCLYSPEGQHTPTQVALTVHDQGVGIPARQIARLFQPFERLERPATSHTSGLGLGLYIARTLVEAMGGTLAVQSCEGNGTHVTLYLTAIPGSRQTLPQVVEGEETG